MSLLGRFQSVFLRFHQRVYQGSGGAIGHRMIGVPTLLLTSTGRKSGKARTAALVYAADGESYVVVASNGGADTPPGWLHNVKAKPSVEVQIGRRKMSATAEPIGPDDTRYGALWKLVNDRNRGRYDSYQRTTARPIELVRLTASPG